MHGWIKYPKKYTKIGFTKAKQKQNDTFETIDSFDDSTMIYSVIKRNCFYFKYLPQHVAEFIVDRILTNKWYVMIFIVWSIICFVFYSIGMEMYQVIVATILYY